jgi:4-amino-4-deoxy-L-arabinose transferase-like glycosyltransferase
MTAPAVIVQPALKSTDPEPPPSPRSGAHPGRAAAAAIAGWYALVWLLARPLSNEPVADSWLYAASARYFAHTGLIRFAGFTDAMPVAQIVLGAFWSKVFGDSFRSFDLMLATVGAATALMFFLLALRCGARRTEAAFATALIVCNPCFLFLSFSFMTDVPFIAMMVAALLAFSHFEGRRGIAWLWLAAALTVGAFLVRPFGGAVAAGCAGAILLFDFSPAEPHGSDWRRLSVEILPFAAAAAACAIIWYWLTISRPPPWDLLIREHAFSEFFEVAPGIYMLGGVLGPALNLGLLLSPLAILQWRRERWREGVIFTAAMFFVTWMLVRAHPTTPQPEFSCFGGCPNALVLRGLPARFYWTGWERWAAVGWGSVGAAGLFLAAREVVPRISRAAAAVAITAIVYWLAMQPLWFFADRYYLILLPAGALMLAMAPLPGMPKARIAAAAMVLVMGAVAAAGVYDYQRGTAAVVNARDWLLERGVPRRAIDAGYPLNGEDLYRYPRLGIDTQRMEAGIPMITSGQTDEYTVAVEPLIGTKIVRRYRWPGPFGFGTREIYVLKRIRTPRPHHRRLSRSRVRKAV